MIHIGRAEIDDRRGGSIENAGKQRSHCDHQEDGKGNAHQQRRELRLVVDQQLIGEFEDSIHGRSSSLSPGSAAAANPDFVRHHHFEIGDLAFDRDLLQRAGPLSRLRQELQQVLICQMVRYIGQERRQGRQRPKAQEIGLAAGFIRNVRELNLPVNRASKNPSPDNRRSGDK